MRLRSIAAYVEGVAKFIRKEVKTTPSSKKLVTTSSVAPKIEKVAQILRARVHDSLKINSVGKKKTNS